MGWWPDNARIAIICSQGPFSLKGDSGCCVLVKEYGIHKAAGVLITKNRVDSFALATPLRIILTCTQEYRWEWPEVWVRLNMFCMPELKEGSFSGGCVDSVGEAGLQLEIALGRWMDF